MRRSSERRGRGRPKAAAGTRVAVRIATLPTQREILRDVMLSAAECETWLTLHELALLTNYGEASISAQLRHLRKRRFGGYFLEKRPRRGARMTQREHGPVWEYQLRRGEPTPSGVRKRRRPVRRGGASLQLALL